MKNNKTDNKINKFGFSVLVVLVALVVSSSCTKNFTDINTNPNTTPHALPQQLLAPALASVMYYNQRRNQNFNNELMQVTVNQSDADATVFRYDFKDSYSDYLYNAWYTELTNFKDLYQIADQEITHNNAYKGIALICQAWVYSLLTDTYGDIPYQQSNQARDSANFEPKFDSQKDIYMSLFQSLEMADTLLKTKDGITMNSDPVFNGDVSKWRRFGNSLYLRMLLRVSGKAEVAGNIIMKIKQIVSDTTDYPVMNSNSDAAVLRWTGTGPYTSPFVSIRAQDFRSPSLCSFFAEHLVAWQDPRIDVGYGAGGINRWGIAPTSVGIQGVASGYKAGAGETKLSYFYATDSKAGTNATSPPAITLQTDPMTGILMNYAELQFILAECAVKGWIPGDAQTYFDKGVESSITYWVPNWSKPLSEYLEEGDIQWVDDASEDQKLEAIGLQKYYALFCVDMQQWFEFRRSGHPVLPKGEGLKNGRVMPARMKYPIYLQATNPTNYKAAVAAQGPDLISTQVWWQKP